MLSGWFGVFKQELKKSEEADEEEKIKKKATKEDFKEFMRISATKEFVKEWSEKKDEDGKQIYTKRGIVELLWYLYRSPGLNDTKKVLETTAKILKMLRGMDGLHGFLAGWKAKSEGIMKGIKSLFGK